MFKVTKFPHGTFSWADNPSTDVEKSKAFYATVMGWETEDVPMGEGLFYTFFKSQGENVAATSPMQPAMQAQGVPSHWMNYVTVADVDALAAKIPGLGGTVVSAPFDVFADGRMMVLQDPAGAMVALWQPKGSIGAGLVNTPGAMAWNELSTRDPQKARDFYGKLLGWEFNTDDATGYNYILNNGRMNGGILPMDESYGDMPPVWTTYFSVANIDEAIAKVEANGGKIMIPKTEAPGVGHFSVINDPAGAVCTIIQLNEPQPWDV